MMNNLAFSIIDDKNLAENLFQLELECFPDDPWSLSDFEEAFKSNISTVFAMKDDNGIRAYAVVYIIDEEAEILNIAVVPEIRRQGVGKIFLNSIIGYCRDKNVSTFFLEVRESNLPAICLYNSVGFAKYNVRKNYYRNPKENAVLMSLR